MKAVHQDDPLQLRVRLVLLVSSTLNWFPTGQSPTWTPAAQRNNHNLSPTPALHNSSPASDLFSCPLLPFVFVFLAMSSMWPGCVLAAARSMSCSVTFHLSTSDVFFPVKSSFPFVSRIFYVNFLNFPLPPVLCFPSLLLSPSLCSTVSMCFRHTQVWTVRYQ